MARIVLLSYGVRRHTKAALAQARRFGHPIHLVPAIPSATRGLRTHGSPLVTVHESVGRDGLLDALGDDDDLVLLLHEDVLLHPDAAARLLEVAGDYRLIVVPSTNHTDVDGPAGDLPGDVVQPLGPRTAPRPIERARTVCLAAPAHRLRGMVQQRLTAATTRLFFPDKTAYLVAEAVATHLDDGPDQLEPPDGPDGRPLLVASMIVRDEEMFLEGCLQSLVGLVDRVDICDTGSTDRTLEIARAAGAVVTEVEWRDDFAWARNHALDMSSDAWWVLQVDADERVRVQDPVAFRRFLATALPDREGFDVPLRDVTADGSELGGQQLPRLFPGAGTRFRGRVHEVAEFADGQPISWAVTTELEIEHHGYRPEVVLARDKQGRNLKLARADHDESPTAITALQLARSLPFGPERLALLETMLAGIRAGDESLNEAGQVPVYQLLAHALEKDGRDEDAWAVISEGRALFPHVPVIRAAHAEIGTRLRRHADVTAAAAEHGVGDEGARPWNDAVSEAIALIELAKSQLATDDVAGAGVSVQQLLAKPVPSNLMRWKDIVSIVALTLPDKAVALLLPHVSADKGASSMLAVGDIFDPADAAAFALTALEAADDPTDTQKDVATSLALQSDAADTFAAMAEALDLDDAAVAALAAGAGPKITAWLRGRVAGITPDDATRTGAVIDAVIAELSADPPTVDIAAAAAAFASDRSGAGMRRLSTEVDPAVAAPIAVAAVQAGLHDEADVRVALVLCTLADDATAAEGLRPHLAVMSVDVLGVLRRRATDRQADAMAMFLTNVMLTRGS